VSDDRYGTDDDEVDLERVRLGMLAEARDPKTFAILDRLGITEGMHVLELGAGAGTVSAWLAEKVGPSGRVMSTDIDLQFHADMPDNVIVRQHDIEHDSLPAEHFHVVHARAVLQHVATRDAVIERLIGALVPGGWLDYGLQVLDRMRAAGMCDLDVVGDVWAMRPGEPSGEWWFLALERAIPRLIEAGMTTEADGATALAQVREPGFVMLSPTSIATIGRRPER